MPPNTNAQAELDALVASTTSLLGALHTTTLAISSSSSSAISSSSSSATTTTTPSINPLALAHDSAALVKAHSTKLSLLLITPPFTPTAVLAVLHALATGPIPALASAVEICTPQQHTLVVRKELAWRCGAVLSELGVLVGQIPKENDDGEVDVPKEAAAGRGSVLSTGVLWAACDNVMALTSTQAVLVAKVAEWRDTVQDVMEELKEWGDEEEDDEGYNDDESYNEDEDDNDNDNNNEMSAQDMIDQLMSSHRPITRADPANIRPRLVLALRKLRLTTHLYQALTKRRLLTFPSSSSLTPTTTSRIDESLAHLARIPDICGTLAGAFYELDAEGVDAAMGECVGAAVHAAEAARGVLWSKDKEEGDGFTVWVGRFVEEMGEDGS